jgi:hypothetical protein
MFDREISPLVLGSLTNNRSTILASTSIPPNLSNPPIGSDVDFQIGDVAAVANSGSDV